MKIKDFIFIVTLVTGVTIIQHGCGRNVDAALMDACERLAMSGNYPEDDIVSVDVEPNHNEE